MAFSYFILTFCFFWIVGFTDSSSLRNRRERAKEIGKKTGYKKAGIKVEKKDEHTWIVKKGHQLRCPFFFLSRIKSCNQCCMECFNFACFHSTVITKNWCRNLQEASTIHLTDFLPTVTSNTC